jgi:surface protein
MTARGLASGLARQLASQLAGSGGGGATQNPAYQILVKTDNAGTSSSTQFTLPATGTYDIDWGDGTVESLSGSQTHTYGSAGNYVIQVTGGLTRISFNNGGDRLKLLEVQNWGDSVWSSFNAAYYGCANCLFSASAVLVLPADCQNAFRGCTSFNQSVANFNTASVTNMASMFMACPAFNQSIASFNTASVTNMSYMFFGCTSFNQSVANFNTALVTNMEYMFNSCSSFNQSLASFNTASVRDMIQMFVSCSALKQSLASFSLNGLTSAARLNAFASNTNINATSTTTNYDATLIAWAAQLPLSFAQSPNFGTAKYSAGAAATARAALVTAGWTITDGGEA